jgi:hypothetical protein
MRHPGNTDSNKEKVMTTFTNNTAPGHEHAIVGVADKGIGVHGTSKTSTGTGGVSDSSIGVHGVSTAGPGVRGDAENGVGVFGRSKISSGIGGMTDSGIGVHGVAKTGVGVRGDSETWQGVYGHSTGNAGVVGESNDFHGVFGKCHNPNGGGVYGTNDAGFGVVGESQSNTGVSGTSKGGEGVRGETNSLSAAAVAGYNLRFDGNGAAIYGEKRGGKGYAGFFDGNVEVTRSLTVKGRGVLVGQWIDTLSAASRDDFDHRPVTIEIGNRHITAEVALVQLTDVGSDQVIGGDWFFAHVGIAQVISDRGVEDFWPDRAITSIERHGVTSITFNAYVASCAITGRYSISFWS